MAIYSLGRLPTPGTGDSKALRVTTRKGLITHLNLTSLPRALHETMHPQSPTRREPSSTHYAGHSISHDTATPSRTTRPSMARPQNRKRQRAVFESNVEGQEQVPPAALLRKRQIGSDTDDSDTDDSDTDDSDTDDSEHQLKRARLTRKNLALFTKASASAPPESTDGSKTTSTTTSGFAIQARQNGMLDPISSKLPTNLEDKRERYARSRDTASPPESAYKRYVNRVAKAPDEATMVFEVGGELLKEYDDEGYTRAFNQAFTGFPKDVGLNNGLSAPQPDFVEGLEMEEYRPFPVDKHVDGAVLYKDNPHSMTLPHLAGEWKGPGKDMGEARLQSAYGAAALVYGRGQALSYLGKSDPPGHAEVTTFATDGTNLNIYAHYAVPSEDGTLEYHQYPIKSTNLIDSHQGFKEGRRFLRNTQDHAREQSYDLKDQLKEHWKQHRGGFYPIVEGALPVADGTSGRSTQMRTKLATGDGRSEDGGGGCL